jgi:RNA-directed DNA polymerase
MIVERMSRDLGLPPKFIHNVASGASHEYKVYDVPKRIGGVRAISHPSRRLKALQRWLLVNVIEGLPVHDAAAAYRKNRSIFDNARVHRGGRYLLRMDLAEFFPSITDADIRSYISEHPALFHGWTPSDMDVFCKLVCRHSRLTIGAPTSPGLSNAVCYDLDVQVHTLCTKNGVKYSRYADDLFFSTVKPNVLRQIEEDVKKVIAESRVPATLKVNFAKTRHSSKRGSRRVTGIVLGSDGYAYIGRALKRRIRALIFRIDSLDGPTRASLAGMIAYATGFDPQFKNSLIAKYGLGAVREAATPPVVKTKAV